MPTLPAPIGLAVAFQRMVENYHLPHVSHVNIEALCVFRFPQSMAISETGCLLAYVGVAPPERPRCLLVLVVSDAGRDERRPDLGVEWSSQ